MTREEATTVVGAFVNRMLLEEGYPIPPDVQAALQIIGPTRFQIDISGTPMSWGVDSDDLAACVLKGVALSPIGQVVVTRVGA